MSPSTFRGSTFEAAWEAACESLGDAVTIVATRKVPKKGFLPFIASDEYEVTAEAPEPKPRRGPPHTFVDAVRLPEQNADPIDAIRSEVRGEIRALRAMLAQRMTEEQTDRASRRELEGELAELQDLVESFRQVGDDALPGTWRRLFTQAGIEGSTAQMLAKTMRQRGDGATPAESFRQAILELLDIGSFPLAEPDRRTLIALVGPAGVGKTTTAAKLAAFATIVQRRTVTLVSTDGFRVGGREQLERFADILGAHFAVATSRRELVQVIHGVSTDVTIVDTAGRSPSERGAIDNALGRLRPPGVSEEDRHVLLCLPAALREVDARRYSRAFAGAAPTGLIVTKIDETEAPSGLLHGPLTAKLPLVAMCFGQRVPEDLDAASHHAALAALCPPRRGTPKPRAAS